MTAKALSAPVGAKRVPPVHSTHARGESRGQDSFSHSIGNYTAWMRE